MAKKDPNSTAGRIRKYFEDNPNAKPREVAAALGINVSYVYNFRYDAKMKRAQAKAKAKAKALLDKKQSKQEAPKQEAPTTDPRVPNFEDLEKSKYFHPLFPVFSAAIHQVTAGKGKRHGGDDIPFMEQPWVHYANLHGRGFLTGQAAKKLEEAASTREGEEYEHEVLGAIAYAGMAVLHSALARMGDDK